MNHNVCDGLHFSDEVQRIKKKKRKKTFRLSAKQWQINKGLNGHVSRGSPLGDPA